MTQRRQYHLADMTYPEVRELLAQPKPLALLPTGATEAHGPHLALATDVIIAEHAAIRAAEALAASGRPIAVLPPLSYSVTDYASDFAGTISISLEASRLLVRDVVLGAIRTGFFGVVICNAHLEPENLRALREGAELAREKGACVAFPDVTRKPHALRLGEEFKSGACHAGRYETSLVLAAQPFAVRSEIASSLVPNPESLSLAIKSGKRTFVEAGGEEAYFGYPAEASEAEGHALYVELADIFATAARELSVAAT